MKPVLILAILLTISTVATSWTTRIAAADDTAAKHSTLWGQHGERWSAESRLPDFSYAGYHRGEQPLPLRKPDCSVKDFGATGDGKTDDTKAFQRALKQSAGKTILVPKGVYVITDFLEIRTRGTVLQGSGNHQAILKFPTPLNEIKPNWGATTSGRRTSNYSWSGGFISVYGSDANEPLSQVTNDGQRGETTLQVSDPDNFHIGDNFCLRLSDTEDQSLARYLYAGDPGPLENLGSRARVVFTARVTRVDTAKRHITFDRPLRTNVRGIWKPIVCAAASSVEEVGIENLVFEFPNQTYKGHFTELGFNAIAIRGARNCWVRNLIISNADSGIFVSSSNVTLSNIRFESQRKAERSRKATGHHGIMLGGQDNLLDTFDYQTRFMHDITVTRGSAGNVVANGKGLDLCFDHHCYAPHANLFTNIDLGEGSRMFQSGGGAKLGRHSAAWETFWGIRARRPQRWPNGWGPDMMNLIGLPSNEPATTNASGRWFEPISPRQLQPANLYNAQLARRLSQQHAVKE